MPSLFVFRGNDQGVRFELDDDNLGLGRDSSNSIQLHDTEVSRRHAILRRQDKTYTLSDLGSSNGTFVNGQRIDTHELASGDEVQLGSTQMLFTGQADESGGDLAEKISIIRQEPDDQSRIVHTLAQEEGSRIFDPEAEGELTPWLARARSNLQVMYRTALAVSHTLDIDRLLDRIMQLIFDWVEADRGCIMLVSADTRELEPAVRRNRQGVNPEETIAISKTILDYVMERNEGVLTSDAKDDNRWNAGASIVQMGIREAICVPMQGRYNMVGVIYIDTSSTPHQLLKKGRSASFTEEHLKLMVAIAHQAALAVEDTRYYSAMVEAERLAAVGQTIATLSHHIKNILQGIRGGSFLIKEGLSRHDETMVGKGWEFVEKNQERISNLVMDMLTFSKEREPELTPGNLNDIVADVVELMAARAQERNVELVYAPAEKLPTLTFDHEGLHRAVLNVITNAIDACDADSRAGAAGDDDEEAEPSAEPAPEPPPGRVEVSTKFDRVAAQASIVVEDNGGGIAPEDIDRIFSLFVSKKGSRGTGLGLPVSQKIMREHGGRIVVESEPGCGSRFILELPATFPEAPRPAEHKTIVVPDDYDPDAKL